MAGVSDRITQARIPLGNYGIPQVGGLLTVNDLLRPFTDTRGDGQMLPEDFSLEELGGLLGSVAEGLSPRAMATGILEAIDGVDETGRPMGTVERFLKLFPMMGGGGGLLGKVGREGAETVAGTVARKGADDIPAGSDIAAVSPDAPIPHGAAVGDIYPDAMSAQKAWSAAGGKQSGLTIQKLPNGTYTHVPVAVPPAVAPNTGAVPAAPGGNPVVVPGAGPPAGGRLPAAPSVDRRGLPGRNPAGPRNPIAGLTDPEGRPLYQEATIAGVRTPGGPDTPLHILEEIALNKALGDFRTPMGMTGANGGVAAKVPGTMNPPAPPQLRIEVDASKPTDVYQNAVRHEGGHAIDYWSERTQRGDKVGWQQYEIPQDVRAELEQASAEMRPDLWSPNAHQIYQRSTAVLDEYRTRPDELMADGMRYYKENPADFKARYPEAAKYIRAQVNDDPLLSGIVQFNVKAKPTGAVAGSLFDHSRLGEVPNVPQFDLKRYDPPRGVSERAQRLDDPKLIRKVNKYVDEGLRVGGAEWYNTEPLRKAFVDELGDEAGQRAYAQYMDLVAATSPRSKVPDNIRNASYYYSLLKRGLPLPEAPPLPPPYGHKAQNLHVQNAHTVAGPGWDVLRNPKPPSFSQNLQGNQRPVTVDTHDVRAWGMLSRDPEWIALQNAEVKGRRPRDLLAAGMPESELRPTDYVSIPNKNEYGFLEQLQQRIAKRKGITPAQYQSSLWIGAADLTGMGSPPASFLKLFEQRVVKTANARGETPVETLRKFINGEAPLLSAGPEAGLVGAAADANDANDDDAVREALGLGGLPAGLVGSVKRNASRKHSPNP